MAIGSQSEVSICNIALTMLGEKSITSLGDDSKQARYCSLRYEDIRNAVLRAHPWNCALARVQLARLADDPAFGWAYQYELPNDYLRIVRLENMEDEYVIEGSALLTDISPCRIIYVKLLTDTTLFDPLLCQAIATRLAWELAKPITGSTEIMDRMERKYDAILKEARSIDAQEGQSNEEFIADLWLRARIGDSVDRFDGSFE